MEETYFRQLLTQAWEPVEIELGGEIPSDGAPRVTVVQDLYTYLVPDHTLAHGSSLGNASAWLTSKGTGAIENLFSTELGMAVTGALNVSYFARYRDLSPFGWPRAPSVARRDPDSLIYLTPLGTGTYVLHPAYQQRHYALIGQIEVLETLFLPRTGGDDPCMAYLCTEVRNTAETPLTLVCTAYLDPRGETPADLAGRYEDGIGLLLQHDSAPAWTCLLASVPAPDYHLLSADVDLIADPGQPYENRTEGRGRLYAGLQHEMTLQPGETHSLSYQVVFDAHGEEAVRRHARAYQDAERVLRRTVAYYRERLLQADVLTPDSLINQGAQWCKANMLRVLAHYPTGWAFTNDPGRSSNVVARDVAWYAYGSDLFYPQASCDMLQEFAHLQETSGKILEYYDARTGRGEDYGMNINDNTPLFVLAVAHHLLTANHPACRETLIEPMCRAAEYLLSQRDARGLVWCTAEGTGEHGICGWRNVMSGEQISGAVTEVNSECYAALRSAASILDQEQPERAARYRQEAEALKTAINTHLIHPRTGIYFLSIGPDGQPRTDITADLVFPQIFGLPDENTAHLISTRLNSPDLMTSGGMRTVSTMNPQYHPDRLAGLLGGVWPGVTWWYAMGCSYANPDIMVDALRISYRQYLRNPKVYNTVPGQFCEWFDGESLVNRGMRLSPWEPPRFLWCVLEGAFGIGLSPEGFAVHPRIPAQWQWLGVRNFPLHGKSYSWFMGKVAGTFRCYTATPFETPYAVEVYDEEVTSQVRTLGEHASVVAWRRADEVLIALGTDSPVKMPMPFSLSDTLVTDAVSYAVEVYSSETGTWDRLGVRSGQELRRLSTWVDARGFALIRVHTA